MNMSAGKMLEVMEASGKAMKTGEIAAAASLDKKAVDKAMKELKDRELITSPGRCFWKMKK